MRNLLNAIIIVWDEKLLLNAKVITFLTVSSGKLQEPSPANAIA